MTLTKREKQVLLYSLFVIVTWLFILVGVLIDYVQTVAGVQGAENIMLFGITAHYNEWYQNLFLVGIISVLMPLSFYVGYLGGIYKLDAKTVGLIILCALGIGSALWDLLFLYLYPVSEDFFFWWFDPFLTVFKYEEGVVWMDAGFMRFFSYLRLLIFSPALVYQLWRVYTR